MRRIVSLAALWIVGCGGASIDSPEAIDAVPANTAKTAEPPGMRADKPLALPMHATFGELIESINLRPERDHGRGSCLVRGTDLFSLEAPIARAMRPLPTPPRDLNGPLAAVEDPVRLLTLWGQMGVEADRLVAATFTRTSANRARPLFTAVTDLGIVVRGEDIAPAPPMTHEQAASAVRDHSSASGVVITAERDIQLVALHRWLADLQKLQITAAFAVMLPEGTRVPEPQPTKEASLRCSGTGVETFGSIAPDSARGVLTEAQPFLVACLEQETGRGARGGRIAVQLRVGPGGSVTKACIADGSFGSGSSERCVFETLRAIEFARPTPAGEEATLLVPVVLRPKDVEPMRPLCN